MNSLWLKNKFTDNEKSINGNCSADVCIIGTGITGLSVGYYLTQSGFKVIIIDKYGIGERTSGHTTAKITIQHGLIYDYLINTYGVEYALKYFEANKQAISNIRQIIEQEKIECDFEEQEIYQAYDSFVCFDRWDSSG